MFEGLKNKLKWVLILIIFLIIIPFIIETITTYYPNNILSQLIFRGSLINETMPNNAWVIVYDGEYYPAFIEYAEQLDLPYSKNGEINTLPKKYIVRAEKARELGYEPNKEAINRGAFTDNNQFLITSFLRGVGLLPKRKGRWNKDGTWNW